MCRILQALRSKHNSAEYWVLIILNRSRRVEGMSNHVARYLKSIRNAEKLRYATQYLQHVTTGAPDPDVRRFNMQNWSAQDVRIRIHASLESAHGQGAA